MAQTAPPRPAKACPARSRAAAARCAPATRAPASSRLTPLWMVAAGGCCSPASRFAASGSAATPALAALRERGDGRADLSARLAGVGPAGGRHRRAAAGDQRPSPPSFRACPRTLFALADVAALFAFVAGSSLAALALAALAVWLRPDGVLLGLLLLTFSAGAAPQARWLGRGRVPASPPWRRGLYAVTAAQAHSASHARVSHRPLRLAGRPGDGCSRLVPAAVLGRIGRPDPPGALAAGRALAAAVRLAVAVSPARSVGALTPFLPLWFLLVGAGLARLLPA